MKIKDFDLVAPFYDRFARLVFGDAIQKSQTCFLDRIAPGSTVLIIGGGTGWILTELLKAHPQCRIVFVEASPKMLKLTQNRLKKSGLSNHTIELICDKDFLKKDIRQYDVLITHFFLDLFTEEHLQEIIPSLKKHLHAGGIWLLSDFNSRNCYASFWKKLLVNVMYLFFRLFANIESRRLYDYEKMLTQQGLTKQESRNYFFQMIEAAFYK